MSASFDGNSDEEGNNEEIINRDGEEENIDVEAIVGDSMCRKVDDDNIVFRQFIQCMQEEKHHKNDDINDNVSVVMMTPNRFFLPTISQDFPMQL